MNLDTLDSTGKTTSRINSYREKVKGFCEAQSDFRVQQWIGSTIVDGSCAKCCNAELDAKLALAVSHIVSKTEFQKKK